MPIQRCPKCKKNGFYWFIEDDSKNTIWRCTICQYDAYEDENKESDCRICKTKSKIHLKDDSLTYRFCLQCGTIETV